ncbi:MAG: hypothetical protein KatS3mg105_1599 [Gemmatales bacterium]|nr:MAG: hypothetical protein KatS3mg105_1599 [Gemmatales bacterium]
MADEAVVVELAPLPREQMGPFLILGVYKDADSATIDAHWAQRVIWGPQETISDFAAGRQLGSRRTVRSSTAGLRGCVEFERRYGGSSPPQARGPIQPPFRARLATDRSRKGRAELYAEHPHP